MTSIADRWKAALDDFVDGLSAIPMPFHGMPGMAVLFGPGVALRGVVNLPLRGLLLAEEIDGCPLGLPLLGEEDAEVSAEMAYDHGAVSIELPFGWLDGTSQIRIVLMGEQDSNLGVPLRTHTTAQKRIAALVAEAMPACGFSDGFRAALAAALPFVSPPADTAGDALFRRGPAGDRLRALAAAHPFATMIAWRHAARYAASGEGEPFPGLTPAHLARLSDPMWEPDVLDRRPLRPFDPNQAIEGENLLRFLAAIPLDWIPTGRGDRGQNETPYEAWYLVQSFRLVRDAVEATGRPPLELVAPCKGAWTAFFNRSKPGMLADLSPHAVSVFLNDPVMDLGRTLILPLYRRLGGDVRSMATPGQWRPVHGLAQRLLYEGKALTACMETADRWHKENGRIQARRPYGTSLDLPWKVPFLPWETEVDGKRHAVVPLDTARAIVEEGSPIPDRHGVPGLDHCVASYVPEAREGRCHILSIRRLLPDGGYERLATAEILVERHGNSRQVTVRQTQGHRNAHPTETVARVLDTWLLADPIDPAFHRQRRRNGAYAPTDPIEQACQFDWTNDALIIQSFEAYAFLLPRSLRTLPALEDHVRRDIAEQTAPTKAGPAAGG